MIRFTMQLNGAAIREVESSEDEITVGRNADNDVQIDNMAVSGRHAVIRREGNNYVIEDLNSTNGTFVGDRRISRRVLREKDLITIGKHTLFVHSCRLTTQDQNDQTSEIGKTFKLEDAKQREIVRRHITGPPKSS